MSAATPTRPLVQAGNVTFELHTLGWEAFQNLCGHIFRQIFGQTVTVFSPTNDAGQDGAFQGTWKRTASEVFSGRFVVQCKFTSIRDSRLSLSDLKDELVKAERLASRGFAHTYLLISNAKVSGEADSLIREAFLKIEGIEHFELFGSEWISQQILASSRLRAFVPRIYGLGDLSQILDERVYTQTEEIIRTWQDNLAKFVPTEAHLKSVKALIEEGFVLLLGDPMAGKTTIAASLAIAAADQWKCVPIFVSHPNDFKTHWNPNEPNQFFWVDDVFGQTQFDPSLTDGWNQIFPMLNAAVKRGAKVLFTSRTYIFQAAKVRLKQTAFPPIANFHVQIEVENLKVQEKERILYNHLRLGDQPLDFKKAIKPHLQSIAANPRFFPEIARRLGNQFFTKSLRILPDHLKQFVEEPREFLGEIIGQLDRPCFAAVSLLFMRSGQAAIPLEIKGAESIAMDQLGANIVTLREALGVLSGSLVSQTIEGGEQYWRFRHPSIRDAMANHVASRPDLVDVYLGGVKASELVKEVVCGDIEVAGAKVHVPKSRFHVVISKLRGIFIGNWTDLKDWSLRRGLIFFLANRCSLDFCAAWFDECREDYELIRGSSFGTTYDGCSLMSRLHKARCLPETDRILFVEEATKRAVESAESMVLCDEDFQAMFTLEELENAFRQVKEVLATGLEPIVDQIEAEFDDPDEEPRDHFDRFSSDMETFRDYFEELGEIEIAEAFGAGKEMAEAAVERLEGWKEREKEEKIRIEEEEEENRAAERAYEDEMLEALVDGYETDEPDSQTGRKAVIPRFDAEKAEVLRSIFDDVDSLVDSEQ